MELNLNFAVPPSHKSVHYEKAYISGNNIKKHCYQKQAKTYNGLALEEAGRFFLKKKREEEEEKKKTNLVDGKMGRTIS